MIQNDLNQQKWQNRLIAVYLAGGGIFQYIYQKRNSELQEQQKKYERIRDSHIYQLNQIMQKEEVKDAMVLARVSQLQSFNNAQQQKQGQQYQRDLLYLERYTKKIYSNQYIFDQILNRIQEKTFKDALLFRDKKKFEVNVDDLKKLEFLVLKDLENKNSEIIFENKMSQGAPCVTNSSLNYFRFQSKNLEIGFVKGLTIFLSFLAHLFFVTSDRIIYKGVEIKQDIFEIGLKNDSVYLMVGDFCKNSMEKGAKPLFDVSIFGKKKEDILEYLGNIIVKLQAKTYFYGVASCILFGSAIYEILKKFKYFEKKKQNQINSTLLRSLIASDENNCSICQDKSKNIIFPVCKHLGMCSSCEQHLKKQICPFCREKYTRDQLWLVKKKQQQ